VRESGNFVNRTGSPSDGELVAVEAPSKITQTGTHVGNVFAMTEKGSMDWVDIDRVRCALVRESESE